MDNSRILEKAKCVYKHLKPYCTAIYLGGSLTQKYINNPHDIDFICFADNEMDRLKMNILLNSYISKHKSEFDEKDDFIQTRNREHEEHAYGSYVHKDMVLLCGKEVEFNFDIINKDRKEYINILKCARFINKKRLYQLYRGYLIVKKKSYYLDEEEINFINVLHDNKNITKSMEKYVLSLIENLEE